MEVLGDAEPQTAGRYRLIAELGVGGMGRVLLGAGPDGRLVAVKQVLAQFVADDGFLARFRREVAASRAVSGAYTAAVVDADADSDTPWLASVYVPGPSLREAVAAAGLLPERAAMRLAAGLASALVEIHQAGLVHRDLKPSNVLLTADGLRVIDFGIARAVDGGGTELTRTGLLVGSPEFMSPEQAEGREVTAASDVFSLGSVLAFACTATSPFAGPSTPSVLYNLVHAEPDLTRLPTSVLRIATLCLTKEPSRRPRPDQLLALIGEIAPAATPWPPAVHRLIEQQHAEVVRVLGGSPADDTVVVEHAPPEPPAEPTTRVVSDPTVEAATEVVSAPRKRRVLLSVLSLSAVVVVVAAAIVMARLAETRATGSEVIAIEGPTDVLDLAFSPDGDLLATGGFDKTVRLWDVDSRRAVGRFDYFDTVTAVAFSPDGRLLAAAGALDMVVLWDVETEEQVDVLSHPEDIVDIAFSPDGKQLATTTARDVLVWDVATGQQSGAPVENGAQDVAFSSDGHSLATAGGTSVRLWDLDSRTEVTDPFDADNHRVYVTAFTPDGATLVVAADDGAVGLWDIASRRQVGKLSVPGVVDVAFSNDGRTMATAGDVMRVWDVASRESIGSRFTDPCCVAFSPDNRTIATSTTDGKVWLYRLPAG